MATARRTHALIEELGGWVLTLPPTTLPSRTAADTYVCTAARAGIVTAVAADDAREAG